MIISWKAGDKSQTPIETQKAYGFLIKHKGKEYRAWFAKPFVKMSRKDKAAGIAEVSDRLYDKTFREMVGE